MCLDWRLLTVCAIDQHGNFLFWLPANLLFVRLQLLLKSGTVHKLSFRQKRISCSWRGLILPPITLAKNRRMMGCVSQVIYMILKGSNYYDSLFKHVFPCRFSFQPGIFLSAGSTFGLCVSLLRPFWQRRRKTKQKKPNKPGGIRIHRVNARQLVRVSVV